MVLKKINRKRIGILILLAISLLSFVVIQLNQEQEDIIGIWTNTETPQWKWEFRTDGKCYSYYDNEISEKYNYSVETTSPQCNQDVPTGKLYSYLKLVNLNESNDVYCYEILSLDKESLQLRQIERGGFIAFDRQ